MICGVWCVVCGVYIQTLQLGLHESQLKTDPTIRPLLPLTARPQAQPGLSCGEAATQARRAYLP